MRVTAALLFALCPGLAWCITVAPEPRFAGSATSVVVERSTGQIAICQQGRLAIYENLASGEPILGIELPGKYQYVREFCGRQVVWVTHDLENAPITYVASSNEGLERLAWPNEGISSFFPGPLSHLCLDGKGIYDVIRLDEAVRDFFGLDKDIPIGAGVVTTYRFAGEKLLARGAEGFATAVALTTDDLIITQIGGGLIRYRSGKGAIWRIDDKAEGAWTITDVDGRANIALALTQKGVLLGIDLEKGSVSWRFDGRNTSMTLSYLHPPVSATPTMPPVGATAVASKSVTAPTPPPPVGVRLGGALQLRCGLVLVWSDQSPLGIGLYNPANGHLGGQKLISTLAAQRFAWSTTASKTGEIAPTWVRDIGDTDGLTLLLRGNEGWWLARLSAEELAEVSK